MFSKTLIGLKCHNTEMVKIKQLKIQAKPENYECVIEHKRFYRSPELELWKKRYYKEIYRVLPTRSIE